MITTNDIKVKDNEPVKKLTIISSNDIKPSEFVVKGKGKAHSGQIITTSNVDSFKHTPREKKPVKKEKVKTTPKKKDEPTGTKDSGRDE